MSDPKQASSNMDPPASDPGLKPETLEEVKEGGPLYPCYLFDADMVYKIAQTFLPGLGTACIDNTTGGLLTSPASVAVNVRREMVEYLTQRSENYVAESVVLEGSTDEKVSDHPFDIITNFVDDFATSKRNFFSRVSSWLLSDRREERIDDLVQEMDINGFWLLGRREAVAQTLLKNVDFKSMFHCNKKFNSPEELAEHIPNCGFRTVNCTNEGCTARFTAAHLEDHDSICPFKIIPCEQNCSDSIMRRNMDRHCITVCTMKLVNCPFYSVGCQFTVPQCNTEHHLLETWRYHLLRVLQVIHKEASLDDLKQRVEQLEKLSSPGQLSQARDIRSLTSVVRDLEVKLGPLEPKTRENASRDSIESPNVENMQPNSPQKTSDGRFLPIVKEEHTEAPIEEKKLSVVSATKEPGSPIKKQEFSESPYQKEGGEESITQRESNLAPATKKNESTKASAETKDCLEPLASKEESPIQKEEGDELPMRGSVEFSVKKEVLFKSPNGKERTEPLKEEEGTKLRTNEKETTGTAERGEFWEPLLVEEDPIVLPLSKEECRVSPVKLSEEALDKKEELMEPPLVMEEGTEPPINKEEHMDPPTREWTER